MENLIFCVILLAVWVLVLNGKIAKLEDKINKLTFKDIDTQTAAEAAAKQEPLKKEIPPEVLAELLAEKPHTLQNIQNTTPPPQHKEQPSKNWELFTGSKLIGWIGGFAAFLAIVFFVKYAFDIGILTPPMKILTGLAAGLAALIISNNMKDKEVKTTSAVLSATGIIFLYVSVYAASVMYGLLSGFAAFISMIFIVITAFMTAFDKDSKALAFLAGLCGFLTPLLLSTGSGNIALLAGYILLLTSAIMIIALKKDWPVLSWLSAAGAYIIILLLLWERYARTKSMTMAVITLLFLCLFFVYGMFAVRKNGKLKSADFKTTSFVFIIFLSFLMPWLSNVSLQFDTGFLLFCLINAALLILTLKDKYFTNGYFCFGIIAFVIVSFWITGCSGHYLFAGEKFIFTNIFTLIFIYFLLNGFIPAVKLKDQNAKIFNVFMLASFVFMFIVLMFGNGQNYIPMFFAVSIVFPGLILLRSILDKTSEGKAYLCSLAAVFITQFAWYLFKGRQGSEIAIYVWNLSVFMVFFLPVFLFKFPFFKQKLPWITAATAGLLQGLLIYLLYRMDIFTLNPCFIPTLLAVIYFAAALAVSGKEDLRYSFKLFLNFALFFAAAIPLLAFSKIWMIAIAWAAMGTALIFIYRVAWDTAFRNWGFWVTSLSFVLFLIPNSSFFPVSAGSILNGYLYAYMVLSALVLASAFLWEQKEEKLSWAQGSRKMLFAFFAALLFVLLNIEIAAFFAKDGILEFRFTNSLAQDMVYTLSWGIFAIALFVFGVAKENKASRVAGLVLLLLSSGKLFLHDLFNLGQLYRVGSLIGIAVMLMLVAYLYQKYVVKPVKENKSDISQI